MSNYTILITPKLFSAICQLSMKSMIYTFKYIILKSKFGSSNSESRSFEMPHCQLLKNLRLGILQLESEQGGLLYSSTYTVLI